MTGSNITISARALSLLVVCNVRVGLLETMELTFLFIYFICPFYLHYVWQLEGSGYSSLGPLSAVRRSYTT